MLAVVCKEKGEGGVLYIYCKRKIKQRNTSTLKGIKLLNKKNRIKKCNQDLSYDKGYDISLFKKELNQIIRFVDVYRLSMPVVFYFSFLIC